MIDVRVVALEDLRTRRTAKLILVFIRSDGIVPASEGSGSTVHQHFVKLQEILVVEIPTALIALDGGRSVAVSTVDGLELQKVQRGLGVDQGRLSLR